MTDAGFFRGTSSEQDNRFSDKEKKLLKQMKFADSLQKKIDMSKVNLNVLKPWISGRVSELLGMEDDVLNEFVFNQLEADNNPDGRRIQINLTGFLNGKNARLFMGELWDMLLDAMEHEGVPTAILDAKKSEIADRIKQEQDDQQKHQKAYESTLRSHHHDSGSSDRRGGGYHHRGDDRDGDRGRHSHSDFGRRSSRFNDDSDRNRDRDRDSGRSQQQQHGFKRSRFSDTQNETEPLKRGDERDSSRHAEHVFEEKTVKKLDRYEDEDGPKVEMKKHKKSKHRHHRKRHDSSSGGSSQSYDEDEDDGRRSKKSGDKKKKKKAKKQRHTSRSRSRGRSEDRSLEQELRDRALESMRKQKEVRK